MSQIKFSTRIFFVSLSSQQLVPIDLKLFLAGAPVPKREGVKAAAAAAVEAREKVTK